MLPERRLSLPPDGLADHHRGHRRARRRRAGRGRADGLRRPRRPPRPGARRPEGGARRRRPGGPRRPRGRATGRVPRAARLRGGRRHPPQRPHGGGRGPPRRRDRLPVAGPLRRLRGDVGPAVDDGRAARRPPIRRCPVVDPPPRPGAAVRRGRAPGPGGRPRAALRRAGLMRAGYLGPPGTFSEEAVKADPRATGWELVPLPTVFDTVMAVQEGGVDRGLVPIENSVEGSVNATLDALAVEAEDVAIVAEVVHAVRQCLIARRPLALEDIRRVVSHPQANAQCARFLRTRLPTARVV